MVESLDKEKLRSFDLFWQACADGDVNFVQESIPLVASKINHQFEEKGTPLYIACDHGHREVVEMLLKIPNIDINKGSLTPLYAACKNGHVEIVDILLKLPNIDVNKGDVGGMKLKSYSLDVKNRLKKKLGNKKTPGNEKKGGEKKSDDRSVDELINFINNKKEGSKDKNKKKKKKGTSTSNNSEKQSNEDNKDSSEDIQDTENSDSNNFNSEMMDDMDPELMKALDQEVEEFRKKLEATNIPKHRMQIGKLVF